MLFRQTARCEAPTHAAMTCWPAGSLLHHVADVPVEVAPRSASSAAAAAHRPSALTGCHEPLRTA